MSAAQYCGLTWNHTRGYNALAAAAEASGGLLHWDKQPLEAFESHPTSAARLRQPAVAQDGCSVSATIPIKQTDATRCIFAESC
jgi:multiple sugar transport system substrate-binding protein